MIMRKSIFILAAYLVAITAGCSDGVPSVLDSSIPIYQSLAVDYDVTGDYTNVGANFKTENSQGANLRMQDGGVTFNGQNPNFVGSGDYLYEYRLSGCPDVKFVLDRIDVGEFTNTVSFSEVVPIAIPDTLSSMGAIQMIYWKGEPIEGNEYVVARVRYDGGQAIVKTSLQQAVGVKVFLYTSNMRGEKATLYLSRVRSLPLQESDGKGGGVINVSYTVSKEIVLR
jgi:hypothetical protein